jgi:hypothetical protein
MMQVIKPGEIQAGCKKNFEPYLTIYRKGIYFSAYLCRKFGLKPFDSLYFVNEGNWWGFYKTKNTDGYILKSKENDSLRIGHSILSRMIKQSLKLEDNTSLIVRGSVSKEVAGEILYELITNKPIEKLKP